MADISALAPVISFAALALGCAIAIRLMLRDMATTYRELGGETSRAVSPVRRCSSGPMAEVVALPLRRAVGDVSRSPNVRLPAAA